MPTIIRITAKKEGFRRAGMAHSKESTDHPEDAFTEEQLKALEAEPNLTVQIIDEQPKAPTITELLKGNVTDVVARIAEASDEIRAQMLKAEQAKAKPRPGVLKALGVEG